jgi:hypothetical protein
MSVNSKEGTVSHDDIQKVDSPRSCNDSSSIGDSIELIVELESRKCNSDIKQYCMLIMNS